MSGRCPPHPMENTRSIAPCQVCGASLMERLRQYREEAEDQVAHWQGELDLLEDAILAERLRLLARPVFGRPLVERDP